MQTLESNYRSLSLLMMLNLDRMLMIGTLALALACGAWLGNL